MLSALLVLGSAVAGLYVTSNWPPHVMTTGASVLTLILGYYFSRGGE